MEQNAYKAMQAASVRGTYGGGALAGTSPSPSTDESASRIRDAVGMTEEFICQLHAAIDRVEKRLDTALVPSPPSTTGTSPGLPESIGSQLLGRVMQANAGLLHASERLNRLAQRVEI